MANRLPNPDIQFSDTTGLPYSGGFLYFYASTTSTPQNTYSDSTLTTPNANPVVLDSAGRAGAIFLSNLAYKVVLKDSNSNIIWTQDPVSTSDYSGVAQFTISSGNPNGSVAGTAGTLNGRPSSVVWDNVNNILYVCTTTGTTTTAVWTAVNAAATTSATITIPQGYLTPTSGVPIIPSDVASAAAVYYTPYTGATVPIYNGTAFANNVFTELTLTLTSSQAASTIYDVFVFNNSGVLTLVTGPAWSTSTAGSGARGSGAGTTQLQLLSGVYVNAVQITGRNSSSTYTVAANQATYLGSLAIDGSAGQVTCHRSFGQSRKWGIWNAYNKAPLYLQAGDGTGSWAMTSVALGPVNGSTANSLTVFQGLPVETMFFEYLQKWSIANTGGNPTVGQGSIQIGFNSTSAGSGKVGNFVFQQAASTGMSAGADAIAKYIYAPATIGINTVTALGTSTNTQTSTTFTGTASGMLLAAQWRG